MNGKCNITQKWYIIGASYRAECRLRYIEAYVFESYVNNAVAQMAKMAINMYRGATY